MRRSVVMVLCSVFLIVAGCQAAEGSTVSGRVAAAGGAAVASTSWGSSEPVPGLAALTISQGNSGINAISCAGPGYCGAGGFYQASPSGRSEGFVVSQVNGVWGDAKPVPGLAALNQGTAQVTSISCPSRGNCGAAGFYTTATGSGGVTFTAGFVVNEVNGVWGQATEVSGLASDVGGNTLAQTLAISCPSAGNCGAGGFQWVPAHSKTRCCRQEGFVTSEVNGTWGKAKAIAGISDIGSISCPSAGNCAAVGGRVVNEVNGTWGKAITLTSRGFTAMLYSVACGAPGDCSAVGHLGSAAGLVSEVNGTWGSPSSVKGTALLPKAQGAQLTRVTCAAAGRCTAAGSAYKSVEEGSSTREYAVGFVLNQRNGTWGSPQLVPGMSALSKNGYNVITAVSCSLPVNCAVGGAVSISSDNPDGTGPGQAFVASKVGGKWQLPLDVTTSLGNQGPAQVSAMACPRVSKCTAGGSYYLDYQQQQAFIVSQVG